MTVLTASQVAGYWVAAGGPRARAVEWVAIAIGESSLDDTIVSPAGAIGLWQIMPFNAGPNGVSVADLYDPLLNAKVAVQMSGGGTNCAAWDSCYRDINASGRYSFLGWPETGSADFNNLAVAAAEIGGTITNPTGGSGQPGLAGTLGASAGTMTQIADQLVPAQAAATRRTALLLGHMYHP